MDIFIQISLAQIEPSFINAVVELVDLYSMAKILLNITKHRKGVEVMECNQGCVTSRICNAFLWPTFVMKL